MVKIKEMKQEFAQLDSKDKKILYELDINARRRASEIGKRVGLSKQVVIYRINKLIQAGVVEKFYAVYDTSKLGFTTYKIFMRLQNVDVEKQKEIIEYLRNHQNVQFLISCDGMFDIVFNVLARSTSELYDIIKDLENRYGNYIAEKELIIMVFSSFFYKDYLVGVSSEKLRKPMYFGSRPEKTEIDGINKKILHYLGMDARMSVVEIAQKIGLSPDAVAVRIRKLEKAQIIHNYILLLNFSLLNQNSYKVLFSLRNLTEEKEKTFFQYCNVQPNIWFHSKSLGRWDLEINMDVDNANQFRQIMMEIKSNFSDIIKEYNTLQVSKVHKFNFYPFKI
jgi:Lrp/AsnC family leucine-responsive transcriptional regulator